MPALPPPATLSPGALQILYTVGAIEHVTSANFTVDADYTTVSAMRALANTFANHIADLLTSISFCTSWRIVNPAGVSLYEEAFPDPIVGDRTPSGDEKSAQSASGSLTGKGLPEIGFAQGQTRTTVFLGAFDMVMWPDAHEELDAGNIDFGPLRQFLNENDQIGADFYGSKATYRAYWCPQFNAHFQNKYGT